jgi:uncharacterized membrane protein
MKRTIKEKEICQVSGKEFPVSRLVHGSTVRRSLVALIKQEYPGWDDNKYISVNELDVFKRQYVREMIEKEVGELSALEHEVLDSIKNAEILAKNIEPEIDEKITFGQKISDKIASFGGSWPFIILFFIFLSLWIALNMYFAIGKSFDPYPFILLNLILSCIASIQAPVIMMSQRRQETRDRSRSEHDYQVNLKAELEIRQLHEKLDHLIVHQMQRVIEIQEIQTEFLEEIIEKLDHKRNGK